MIYLKVRGGLCNRIRAIDSLFLLCKEHQKDLTVFWPMDIALNAAFESLFLVPEFTGFDFKIINCPPGYPELYFPNLKNSLKNLIKGRKLDKTLIGMANLISNIPGQKIMTEGFLDNQYNRIISETQGEVEAMDNLFCERLRDLTNSFFQEEVDVYINSCYRLAEVKDNYKNFVPVEAIEHKIEKTVKKFSNTFGLHIRRSDHTASKAVSTLEKFTTVIDEQISMDPNTTFFLSTDDEETKQDLILKYGDKIIYNEIASFDRNSPEAVEAAVLDLFCLSNTKKVFGSHYSSFSQVAAKIGRVEVETVR